MCTLLTNVNGWFQTNEEGSEAAAATSIQVVMLSASLNPPPPLTFNADHPFIYTVANDNGDVLFSGIVRGN